MTLTPADILPSLSVRPPGWEQRQGTTEGQS